MEELSESRRRDWRAILERSSNALVYDNFQSQLVVLTGSSARGTGSLRKAGVSHSSCGATICTWWAGGVVQWVQQCREQLAIELGTKHGTRASRCRCESSRIWASR